MPNVLATCYYYYYYWPTDVSVEAIVIVRPSVRPSVSLCVTTVSPGQTSRRFELIFGTDFPLPKRHHVLGDVPSSIWGEIRGPKFWVEWKGIGKFQAIVTKFCTATTDGQRNMPAKFQLNRPKMGSYGPQSLGYVTELIIIASK